MIRELLFSEEREVKTREETLKLYTVLCSSGRVYRFTAHGHREYAQTREFYVYDIENYFMSAGGYIHPEKEKVCELGSIEKIGNEPIRRDTWTSRNIDYGRDRIVEHASTTEV